MLAVSAGECQSMHLRLSISRAIRGQGPGESLEQQTLVVQLDRHAMTNVVVQKSSCEEELIILSR